VETALPIFQEACAGPSLYLLLMLEARGIWPFARCCREDGLASFPRSSLGELDVEGRGLVSLAARRARRQAAVNQSLPTRDEVTNLSTPALHFVSVPPIHRISLPSPLLLCCLRTRVVARKRSPPKPPPADPDATYSYALGPPQICAQSQSFGFIVYPA
jgi:hypothetical protein